MPVATSAAASSARFLASSSNCRVVAQLQSLLPTSVDSVAERPGFCFGRANAKLKTTQKGVGNVDVPLSGMAVSCNELRRCIEDELPRLLQLRVIAR
jgi:hypothetical protein